MQQLINGNIAAQAKVAVRIRNWPHSSPFHWLLPLPPVSKGKAGRIMIEELLRQNGYSTGRASGVAQSLKVTRGVLKTKLSLEWDAGTFAFEQIEDDPYDFLAMLGASPQRRLSLGVHESHGVGQRRGPARAAQQVGRFPCAVATVLAHGSGRLDRGCELNAQQRAWLAPVRSG
jgi:hypothetical protein